MQPLIEQHLFEYTANRENMRDGVLAVVGGVGQRSDEKNANGRIYSRALWERILPTVQERIKCREMVGELDHPQGEGSAKQISHLMTEARLEPSGDVYVEYEVLDTPQGRILDSLLRADVKIGISSRGEGELVNRSGQDYVDEESYVLDTFDNVINPSTRGAYPALIAQREEREKNTAALLATMESMCTPDTPPKVLSGVQRIVESIETEDHQDRKHQLLTSIHEAITPPAKGEDEPNSVQESKDMDKELLEKLKTDTSVLTMVESMAKEQASKIVGKYRERLEARTTQVADLTDRVNAANKKVAAANKVCEALQTKVQTGQTQKVSESKLQAAYNVIHERYQVACRIIEEQLPIIAEHGTLQERHEAACHIIEGDYQIFKEAEIKSFVEAKLEGNPAAEQIAEMCEGVQSVQEAEKIIDNATKLAESASKPPTRRNRREPLPGDERDPKRTIRESRTLGVSQSDDPVQAGIDKILKRCGG